VSAPVHPIVSHLLVGHSPPMHRLRLQIERLAPTGLPLLIQGPTGSGKELVAEALHARSGRAGRFVPFNVCAIGEGMLEDTLFGHVRGAFTGAVADSRGLLLEADRGTAFFDEIGTLSLAGQGKLLRAVETKRFRPVGGSADRDSDFRVVSATNEDIASLVRAGSFREDLAHRLAGWVLEVPPLRDRRDDLPDLVQHFARTSRSPGVLHFTTCALEALQAYAWPGNVRELKHVVECAATLTTSGAVGGSEVRMVLEGLRPVRPAVDPSRVADPLVVLLRSSDWDVRAVAEQLGVHRATIYRRLHRLGVTAPAHAESVRWPLGGSAPRAASVEVRDSRATVAARRATGAGADAWIERQVMDVS
jgi:two-component system response regulator HydG